MTKGDAPGQSPERAAGPDRITTDQTLAFAEAMLRGDKSGWKLIKPVRNDRIREMG